MKTQEIDRKINTIARECLAVRVRSLNRVITRIYDRALRPLGLKASQLNILVATGKLGLAHPREVCKILQLDTSTLSRNAERMRARGWLEGVTSTDARSQPFRLTASGRRLLERALPAWEQAQKKAVVLLGKKEVILLDVMTRNLNKMRSG